MLSFAFRELFSDLILCEKNFKIPSFLGCSKLVSMLPGMSNVHLQFSTKPISTATFTESIKGGLLVSTFNIKA